MSRVALKPEECVLVVIDVQPKFMTAIADSDRVDARSRFLVEVAHALGVPILGTEQNRARMGELDPRIAERLSVPPIDKMSFGCTGAPAFVAALEATGRRQVVVVGIETHICVSLTALSLVESGYSVVVCPDAVSSRTVERHKLGMERLRDGGVVPAHTEAVCYEWMDTAEHPKFRDVLSIVKSAGY